MTELLTPAAATGPGHSAFECRVYERLECELASSCQPATAFGREEPRWTAKIRDISQGGVRLLLRRRYERGTGLAIELPGAPGKEPSTVLVKVVHVRSEGGGSWSLGCKFISPLSEEELQLLLDPIRKQPMAAADEGPPELERPTEPETVRNVRLRLVTPSGALVDCLVRCLRLRPTWPLKPGAVVRLRGSAANGAGWGLRVQVVRCAPQGDNWVLDCQLAKPPRAVELLRALAERPGHD